MSGPGWDHPSHGPGADHTDQGRGNYEERGHDSYGGQGQPFGGHQPDHPYPPQPNPPQPKPAQPKPAQPKPAQPNPTQQLPGVPAPSAYGHPYPQDRPYQPTGGNAEPSNYAQPGGYGQPSNYAQPGGYGQPSGYAQPGGYGQPSSNAQPGGYGQPSGYAQPGGYPAGGFEARPTAGPAPGTTGIVVSSVGAALALLGTFVSWYAAGSVSVSLKDIVSATGRSGAPGFAHLYFGRALWVVLAIAICLAVAANLVRTSAAAVAGAVVAVASSVLTYAALDSALPSGRVFDRAAIGLWLVLMGPLVLAVGSLLGLFRARAS